MKNIALKRAVGNTYIQPHGILESYDKDTKNIESKITYRRRAKAL
jgi:hypothetical protein